MSERYVELHCHSCFSLLDGASTPEALLDQAGVLGMPALALTDHDGLYGAVRFALAARQRDLRPLIGAELTLESGLHLLLLAQNRLGYANLCWLISRAQLGGTKWNARLPSRLLHGRTEGLIALTGCRNGVIAVPLLAGQTERAADALRALKKLFGPNCLYVEIERHLLQDEETLVDRLTDLARRLNLPLVATNNVHYARHEDHRLQDVLVAIRHNTTLAEAGGLLRPNSEYYLKGADEMAALFADYPDALSRTLEIAGRCHVDLNFRGHSLPAFDLSAGQSAGERLAELCEESLPKRYGAAHQAARCQLEHELSVIQRVGLAEYFLTVWDIVRFSREQNIQVQGRGSAANSIVAYLLGITRVDPLEHHLLFERFLSAEARVMPDIDIDFCARRREEVVQYLYRKYGESHVGMVCNYVTYRPRSAVRDVGKALGLPSSILGQVARSLKGPRWGAPGDETSRQMEKPVDLSERIWTQFLELFRQIQDIPRHLSIHVGGMCITRAPLDELVPLERATMPGRVVIQWDKDSVEDAGLIKIDLLCLRTLSAVDECLHLITETRGERVNLDAIPLHDPAVYRALQQADTIGAFQVESRAQQQALIQMKPKHFADIVIEVALIRPGPLQGNMVHPFFRRRQGLEPTTYFHPTLKPILAETLGVVVFQEQVIRIAMSMGGFSAGEADLLRRAMSRHRSDDEMAQFRSRFVAGAAAQGIESPIAEEVFDKLAGFASYGFCKSHAAAFARTAYETLYLRAHYPAEYTCALLNNQPMGFYPPRVLIGDARRHGVSVLPVHLNLSGGTCTMERGAVRLGFRYVSGLGDAGIERILAARIAADGRFVGMENFCRRTRLPRQLVENLILAGAIDEWTEDRRRLLWDLGRLRYQEEELPMPLPPDTVNLEPMTYAEQLLGEYDVTGLSANGHIMELFRDQMQGKGIQNSENLTHIPAGQVVRIAGAVVIRQAPPTAKGFVFITLEDEFGLMNVIVRPDVFAAHRFVWTNGIILIVEGQVQRSDQRVDILARSVWNGEAPRV